MTEDSSLARMRRNFSKYVLRSDADSCWTWTGYYKKCRRGTHNYGGFTVNGRSVSAHRAAWLLFVGPLSKDQVVCHKCDNPACVNISHLFAGTQKDNMRDMLEKGRKPLVAPRRKTDGKPLRAALTDSQISEVRSLRGQGKSQQHIANLFGVSQPCISRLLRGVTDYAK